MIAQRAHKIQLDPTVKQVRYFQQACGTARFVWNWALAEWDSQYQAGLKPNAPELKKQFNACKYEKWPWLENIHRDAHSQPFTDLHKAFQAFFGKHAQKPKFKKRGRCKDSFYVANDKFQLDGTRIRLPVIGWVRMTEALRFEGKRQYARVSRVADRWFVSISVEAVLPDPTPGAGEVGVDVGIKTSIVVSDGTAYQSPKPLRKKLKRLRRLSRRHSKKVKGSRNKRKSADKLAKLHWRIANVRRDFISKSSTDILSKNHAVAIEDLLVSGMLRNRKLSKAIADEGFAELRRQLEYKASAFGAYIHKVDRFFPSSKRCSSCGHTKATLKLFERVYICANCGLSVDRDLNAALNLKSQLPAASREVKPVDRRHSRSVPEDGMKQELYRAHSCAQER